VASKKFAEKAAFEFVEKEKTHFDIVTILPSFILGPAEGVVESSRDISSLNIVNRYISTQTEFERGIPSHHEVDVRDVALALVLAYENPQASNQRYLVSNEPFAYEEIVEFAHKEFPGKTKAIAAQPYSLDSRMKIDNSKSKKELGLTYRTKHETFRDSIANLLELKQQGKLLE